MGKKRNQNKPENYTKLKNFRYRAKYIGKSSPSHEEGTTDVKVLLQQRVNAAGTVLEHL